MTETQTEGAGGGSGSGTPKFATGFSDDIQSIGDQIANLTLKQAVELGGYLKDKYGIEAAAGGVIMDNGPGGPVAVEPEPEKTTFDIMLVAAGDKKINVIKEVRAITGLGLKEAKDLVDGAPKTIKENVPKDEAEKIKATIEAAGGKVELR